MSTREHLTDAILADRESDAPRLVFADFLDEAGEPERAELVRVQCRLATLEDEDSPELYPLRARAWELLGRLGALWREAEWPARPGCQWGRFRRGFVDQLTLTGENLGGLTRSRAARVPFDTLGVASGFDWSALDDPDFRAFVEPVRGLSLWYGLADVDVLEALDRSGWLEALERVDLSSAEVGPDEAAILAGGGRPVDWRRLALSGSDLGGDGLLELADLDAPALERLDLAGTDIEPPELSAFLSRTPITGIRHLVLTSNAVGGAGLAAVLRKGWPLEGLALAECGLGAGDWSALARSDGPPRLRWLELMGNDPSARDWRDLLSSPALARLDTLRASACGLGDFPASLLAAAPFAGTLRALDLSGNDCRGRPGWLAWVVERVRAGQLVDLDLSGTPLGDAGLAELLEPTPRPLPLARLHLARCGLTRAAGRILTNARHLTALQDIDLSDNAVGDPAFRAVARSEQFAALQRITLENARGTPAGHELLLTSETLGGPVSIRVPEMMADPRTAARLSERFGDG